MRHIYIDQNHSVNLMQLELNFLTIRNFYPLLEVDIRASFFTEYKNTTKGYKSIKTTKLFGVTNEIDLSG